MNSITPVGRVLFIGLTIFAIVYDRMWEKLPEDSLAVSSGGRPKDELKPTRSAGEKGR